MENDSELEKQVTEDKNDDYGDKTLKIRKRKQRLGMAATILVIAAIAAGSITIFVRTRKSDDEMSGQDFGRRSDGFSGENIVTATGTTSIGIEAVTFDIDFLENTSLYVEEVYLDSGDEVEAGTKYLKLTQDSVDEARKELESTLLSAQLEYRSGVISNQESMISAKYDYDLTILESQQAQSVYDDTIAALQVQLDKAQTAYDDANEAYNELYYAIENNTFYEDYDIAALKKAYEDAMDLYDTKMADWELTEDDLESSQDGMGAMGTGATTSTTSTSTSSSSSSSSSTSSNTSTQIPDSATPKTDSVPTAIDDTSDSTSDDNSTSGDNTNSGSSDNNQGSGDSQDPDNNQGSDNNQNNNNPQPSDGNAPQPMNGGGMGGQGTNSEANEQKWILKAASLLKAEYEEAEEEYEQALSDYEDARESADLDIQQLYLDLETAREDYEDASLRFQKESQSAKTKYETAIVKGETAQLDYETQLTSLEEQLEKLADAKDEAEDNLALFESTVGDGYLYTEEAGTILMVMTQEDNVLSGGEMLFAYSNPEKISVSVSVSQDYIAQLYVGEDATVIIDEYGQYTGTVQTINPVSSSDSRTSVSYTVTVLLDTEDVSDLSANLTATVIFGTIEMPEGMENGNQPDMETPQGMENGNQPDMETPQGMENGNQPDMEAPQGMDNGNQPDMEAPQGMENGNQPDMETPQGMDNNNQPDMNSNPQGEEHEE